MREYYVRIVDYAGIFIPVLREGRDGAVYLGQASWDEPGVDKNYNNNHLFCVCS